MKQLFYALKRFFRREIPVTTFDEQVVRSALTDQMNWTFDWKDKGEVTVYIAKHRTISVQVASAGNPQMSDYSAVISQHGGFRPAEINQTLAENLWWALHARHEAQQRQYRKEWTDKVTAQLDDLDSNRVSDNTE